MTAPIFEITKAATFDAAHFLPQGPETSPYRRLHGHSFRVEATVCGPVQGRRAGSRTWASWTRPSRPSPASSTIRC